MMATKKSGKPKSGGESVDRVSRNREGDEAAVPIAPTRTALPVNYARALSAIKRRIQDERMRIVPSANSAMVLLYWDIGQMVLERQSKMGWGSKVIDRLADPTERELYIDQAVKHGRSRSILGMQIAGRAHERHGRAITNFQVASSCGHPAAFQSAAPKPFNQPTVSLAISRTLRLQSADAQLPALPTQR